MKYRVRLMAKAFVTSSLVVDAESWKEARDAALAAAEAGDGRLQWDTYGLDHETLQVAVSPVPDERVAGRMGSWQKWCVPCFEASGWEPDVIPADTKFTCSVCGKAQVANGE